MNKKIMICFIVFSLVCTWTSCASPLGPQQSESPLREVEDVKVMFANRGHYFDSSWEDSDYDSKTRGKANSFLESAGYSLQIEPFYIKTDTPWTYMDDANSYVDAVANALALELANPNTIAIVDEEIYSALHERDCLGDVAATLDNIPYMPQYLTTTGVSIDGNRDFLPLPHDRYSTPYAAVLIRKDVYDAYGYCVDTPDDYEDFLSFAKSDFPHLRPGLMPTRYNEGIPLYDIFLPSANALPLDAYGLDGLYMDQDGVVCETRKSALVLDALYQIKKWNVADWLDINPNVSYKDYERYASVIVNVRDFLGSNKWTKAFNASEYHICIFNEKTVPEYNSTATGYRVVMGSVCDPTEFLGFMGRLYVDVDFYRQFKLGVEGEDYLLAFDGGVDCRNDDYFQWWWLNAFTSNEFEKDLCSIYAPSNLYDVFDGITYPQNANWEQLMEKRAEMPTYFSFEVISAFFETAQKTELLISTFVFENKTDVNEQADWPDLSAIINELNTQ